MTAVIRTDTIPVLCVDDCGELVGRFGEDFDWDLFGERVVSLISALGDKAGEFDNLRCSANRANVLIENLVSRNLCRLCPSFADDFNFIWIIRRSAVLL